MSAVELVELPAEVVVPDGVEAIEQYRVWDWNGSRLISKNGQVWKPGEALHATCQGGPHGNWELMLVRYGLPLKAAQEAVASHNQWQQTMWSPHFTMYGNRSYSPQFLVTPTVEPPHGYGYKIERTPHESPHENCTCGIYAGADTNHGYTGDVWGKVKMWGKIVPGDKGARAEFAYPSELHVPPHLADDPAILAYGVPVVVDDESTALDTFVETIRRPRDASWWMKFAGGLNFTFAALNLSLVGLHVFH